MKTPICSLVAFLQALSISLVATSTVVASDTAKVVCGGGISNKKCENTPKVVSKTEEYGARCCSPTEFFKSEKKDKYSCSVYAGSKTNITGTGLEDAEGHEGIFCAYSVTYAEAELHCANLGAEICTEDELNRKCAKSTGCGLNGALVWAQDVLDKFDFYAKKDSFGNDIVQSSAGNINAYANECITNPNCKGFNSNGWIKHTISAQNMWETITYQEDYIGLYVKKE